MSASLSSTDDGRTTEDKNSKAKEILVNAAEHAKNKRIRELLTRIIIHKLELKKANAELQRLLRKDVESLQSEK